MNNYLEVAGQIPQEIVSLLWFKNGRLANYSSNNPLSEIKTPYFTFQMSFSGAEEPSLIAMDDPVVIEKGTPPILGYYPSYRGMSPSERGYYLKWLTDITRPIDIGYVFVFYYGLERHMYEKNKLDEAFNMVMKLRRYHKHPGFQGYSLTSLVYFAIMNKREDLLCKIMNGQLLYNSASDPFILAVKTVLRMPIQGREIVALASRVGFKNQRYIKTRYDLFISTLDEVLYKHFSINEYLVDQKEIENTPKRETIVIANISIEKRTMSLPEITKNPYIMQDLCSLLTETHNLVKEKIKKERRNKKAAIITTLNK